MSFVNDRTVALVTGATDGLGRRVAGELSRVGATVLVHGRAPAKVNDVVADLRRDSDRVRGYVADFASLAAVRDLAGEITGDHAGVHVLVNNAGIGGSDGNGSGRRLSQDGHELRFQVNYLAHFLLTALLVPAQRQAAPARIVNVTSGAQRPLDFDDLMLTDEYDGMRAYGQSKLAQILFTFELAERLSGSGVTVNCLHPATFMPTKMVTGAGINPMSTLEAGTEATLRLIAAPQLQGVTGHYYSGLRQARAHPQAYDPTARRRLWERSIALTGAPDVAA